MNTIPHHCLLVSNYSSSVFLTSCFSPSFLELEPMVSLCFLQAFLGVLPFTPHGFSSWLPGLFEFFPDRFSGSYLVPIEIGRNGGCCLAGQVYKMHTVVKEVEMQKPEPNGKHHLGCYMSSSWRAHGLTNLGHAFSHGQSTMSSCRIM